MLKPIANTRAIDPPYPQRRPGELRLASRLRKAGVAAMVAAFLGLPACSSRSSSEPHPVPLPGIVAAPTYDRDGDGITDAQDQCPDQAEDFDEFEDADGCPDPDNDRDGVLDVNDACPLIPGSGGGDGCPTAPIGDRDGDGMIDVQDRCPDDPEDRDGFQDEDGCPDVDNDADGISDVDDRCPNEREDADGFQDDDGCPD